MTISLMIRFGAFVLGPPLSKASFARMTISLMIRFGAFVLGPPLSKASFARRNASNRLIQGYDLIGFQF